MIPRRVLGVAMAAALGGVAFVILSSLVALGLTHHLDFQLATWLHGNGQPALDLVLAWVGVLGNWELVGAAGVATFAFLHLRGHRREALTLLTVPVGVVLEILYKTLIFQPGPAPSLRRGEGIVPGLLSGFSVPTNGSFPSGHALRAVLFYALVAWILVRLNAERRMAWPAAALLAGAALLVPLSRLYLGEHWASDVVGAVSLGVFLGGAAIALVRLTDQNPEPGSPARGPGPRGA